VHTIAVIAAFAVVQNSAPEQLGTVHFPTSCSSAAQPQFDRAVSLLHSFAFSQANDAFAAVRQADPGCAMAWWGTALTAWTNPFTIGIKGPAQIRRGLDAITRARAAGTPTARETAYIEAVAKLYERADSLPQRRRLMAYRDAMAELVSREPADTEAMIFHALAQVASADPTDKTYAAQLAAGATLERLFERLPDHPGLAHYIIHAYDVPPLANRAEGAAARYAHIAPQISHALHMPSHTWTRVGAWQQSVEANIASAAAARREGATAEELHASDYMAYAWLQMGRDSAVLPIMAALPAMAARIDPSALGTGAPPAAGYFAVAAIPARYALERGAWAEAARLEVHPSPAPFADALTWFARGLGAARSGKPAEADSALQALASIGTRFAQAGESYWAEQVAIQRLGVSAWSAWAAGRPAEALAQMRAAADREDATEKSAITPGPLAPARELLGEMLLAAGEPALAQRELGIVLLHEPGRHRTTQLISQAMAAMRGS